MAHLMSALVMVSFTHGLWLNRLQLHTLANQATRLQTLLASCTKNRAVGYLVQMMPNWVALQT